VTASGLPCKFCHMVSIADGGVLFTDFDGIPTRTCWKTDCQSKYHWELERIEFREKRRLQITGKCIFKLLDGFCAELSITGEFFCKDHLIRRCAICGKQATRACPKKDWGTCDLVLCHEHTHIHTYYH